MTLIALALLLTFMVFALVFITWDIRTAFRKQSRYITVDAFRFARDAEDRAWAEFLAESDDRRRQLESVLETDGSSERLRDLIDAYTTPALRVVA